MSQPSPRGRARAFGPISAAVLIVAFGAAALFQLRSIDSSVAEMSAAVDRLAAQSEHQSKVLQLFRLERQSKSSMGIAALLEQLRFWGPSYFQATTPGVQLPQIKERLTSILDAMEALGTDVAFPALVAEFRSTDAERDDALREWLLRAMAQVDRPKAVEFLDKAVRGYDFAVSPRLRLFAAKELVRLDKSRAAVRLAEILQRETFRGIDQQRMPPNKREEMMKIAGNITGSPGFFNLIDAYVATDDPDREQILLIVIGRTREHDMLTIQAAVKALGQIGTERSVATLKKVFEHPPANFSPMFRNHCLDAIANIQGAAACDYFRKLLRQEQRQIVTGKLNDLIKRHCG